MPQLKLTPMEAYAHMNSILIQVNAIMGTFHVENLMADDARMYDERMAKLRNRQSSADGSAASDATSEPELEWHLEDRDDSDLYFSPELGNVIFSSAVDGWAFRTENFAQIYASKLGVKVDFLRKVMWGDFYLDPKTKRAIGPKGLKGRPLKPFFVQFALENIWAVHDAVMNDREKVEKIVKALNLKILPRDLKAKDSKLLLQAIMSQWLPLADTVLMAVVDTVSPPPESQKARVALFFDNDPQLKESTRHIEEA
ncbi:Cytoplasmic GTPase/eEF2-like protein (ribosomal biogenesis), partial [Cladochytrium tenue]